MKEKYLTAEKKITLHVSKVVNQIAKHGGRF